MTSTAMMMSHGLKERRPLLACQRHQSSACRSGSRYGWRSDCVLLVSKEQKQTRRKIPSTATDLVVVLSWPWRSLWCAALFVDSNNNSTTISYHCLEEKHFSFPHDSFTKGDGNPVEAHDFSPICTSSFDINVGFLRCFEYCQSDYFKVALESRLNVVTWLT